MSINSLVKQQRMQKIKMCMYNLGKHITVK
jgi:hypothetical protein